MSVRPLLVIDVVGLSQGLLGPNTPWLNRFGGEDGIRSMTPAFPALTTTAQTSMLTGCDPAKHGIVGNGWYWREAAEVRFWQQSNELVQRPRVWETLREANPDFRCANLFWWYNLYSGVDFSITPRPHYPADGRKVVDLDSKPEGLHQRLEKELGRFPFFQFWGPGSGLPSSQWIADAALRVFEWYRPDLQLVYLPHLDYNLQRLGPDDPAIAADLRAVDKLVAGLADPVIDQGGRVLVVSEYGIEAVQRAVHLNRVLRRQGYLQVRNSLGWELLEPGASRAFAVADHQVAHVYVRQRQDIAVVKDLLEALPGVGQVLDADQQWELGIYHPRSGELLVSAEPGAWFTYYYWLDDERAPDFASTVDIHRKPGYDPAELFIDPGIHFPRLKLARRLAQKALGMRMLMDMVPIHGNLVRGSHGRINPDPLHRPLIISNENDLPADGFPARQVHEILLHHFGL